MYCRRCEGNRSPDKALWKLIDLLVRYRSFPPGQYLINYLTFPRQKRPLPIYPYYYIYHQPGFDFEVAPIQNGFRKPSLSLPGTKFELFEA